MLGIEVPWRWSEHSLCCSLLCPAWFYPKDGGVNPGGGGGAVMNWTAMPSVFPHGMEYIQSKLGAL